MTTLIWLIFVHGYSILVFHRSNTFGVFNGIGGGAFKFYFFPDLLIRYGKTVEVKVYKFVLFSFPGIRGTEPERGGGA